MRKMVANTRFAHGLEYVEEGAPFEVEDEAHADLLEAVGLAKPAKKQKSDEPKKGEYKTRMLTAEKTDGE